MTRKARKKMKKANRIRRAKRDECNGKGRAHNPTPKQARA